MILQGIDPGVASCLHRIHVQNNSVWEDRPLASEPLALPGAVEGLVQPAQRRPSGNPPEEVRPAQPEPAGSSGSRDVPIRLGPTPEFQRIGHLMKEELFDMAISLTRRQDLCIDTLEQNGANSMLHGTMETLQHGKCLVKIPIRAVEILKVVDHPY